MLSATSVNLSLEREDSEMETYDMNLPKITSYYMVMSLPTSKLSDDMSLPKVT